MAHKLTGRERRKRRVRFKISGTAERPRLSVFRSLNHVSAQLIDDTDGKTLVSASTYEKSFQDFRHRGNKTSAKRVGELIAERALAKNINKVIFDRNGYQYHGCVKELAEAARQKGLKF
jgi:large subunit ribosomal protein L18